MFLGRGLKKKGVCVVCFLAAGIASKLQTFKLVQPSGLGDYAALVLLFGVRRVVWEKSEKVDVLFWNDLVTGGRGGIGRKVNVAWPWPPSFCCQAT
jgi:hypothetical protein